MTHLELMLLTAGAGQSLALDFALDGAQRVQHHLLQVFPLTGAAFSRDLADTVGIVKDIALDTVPALEPAAELAERRQQLVLCRLELFQEGNISCAGGQHRLGETLQRASRVLERSKGRAT